MAKVTEPVMAVYPLRAIPLDLWSKVKARATTEGRPVREVIIDLLRAYAAGVAIPKRPSHRK
jgi:hypothetical protein